jgi:nucleoside-diphosphate-sugar epimerase
MAFYLVTGGAGFIGSNLVEALLKQGETLRVLDNFSTGKEENLLFTNELSLPSGRFTLIKGDIRDLSTCHQACEKVDFVLHQAALGSVPRSVNDPITTNEVNIQGTLNLLVAARDAKVKRFIYASSSSVYGNPASAEQQEGKVAAKVESQIPNPQSPYAISKLTGEYYCKVFHEIYELGTISLRYFNVFGQRQDAHSAYAAVVPKFIQSLLNNQSPTIYGDGEQSRDFSHIDNVVQANCNACHAPQNALGEAINIACGASTTVNQLYSNICEIMNKNIKPLYASPRPGDIKHSLAATGKASNLLHYAPQINVATGIKKSIEWFSNHFQKTTVR